ncbi:MAG: DinB family protein [Armatimonadota bacterium]|nr:DinB family protein [Armatimonadota bacterium]MDR7427081.1 DinB family protein [Armatimonadota bacterium]MDR7464904.1 DinB family protein [Armatimonadota bacterium]MDR7471124.1 DinB family protein [Armatimonadota bacterium]MDR7474151.1 DinB family protein [Armatimonadota bacterium]
MSNPAGLDPVEIYEYLVRARRPVLERVETLSDADYTRQFPFGERTIRHTLAHIAGAEWAYNRRLRGEPVPPLGERPFTRFYQTGFPPLQQAWEELAEETRRTLRGIGDWSRPVEYVAAAAGGPGVRIRTTTGGVATQLVLHEVHHRAQVMAMLRHLNVPVESLDYSILMFVREEAGT